MTSTRPTPINDDHGDQFPGALPAPAPAAPTPGAEERLVRMPAASTLADRDRRVTGQRTPTRGQDGRRPGRPAPRLVRMRPLSRSSIERLAREVFDAGTPEVAPQE